MERLKNVFWNAEEHRLRTLWRIVIFLAIAAILVNPVILLLDAYYESVLSQMTTNVIVGIGFFLSLVMVAKYFDKSSLETFGFHRRASSFLRFLKGTLFGAALITIVVGVSWLLGLISLQTTFYISSESTQLFLILFLGQCVRYIFGSLFEELFSRAYLIKNIAEGIRHSKLSDQRAVIIASVATSLLFGILHLFNPDFNIISAINLSLLGLLFAFSYIYSGDLAWPIGIHFGWNVFQNIVFGYANSGKPTEVSIFKFELHQSPVLNGGDFGLEASLLSTIVLVLAIVSLLVVVRRRNPDLRHQLSLYARDET